MSVGRTFHARGLDHEDEHDDQYETGFWLKGRSNGACIARSVSLTLAF